MIIDSHTHIFPPDMCSNRASHAEDEAWFCECYADPKAKAVGYSELIASMDQAGVDKAVVCGFGWQDPGRCRYHNDYTLEASRKHPGRLIGLATIPMADKRQAARELDRCISMGLRGLGELNPNGQGFSLLDFATVGPVVATLAEHSLPMLLHCSEPVGHLYPGKGQTIPPIIYQFVRQFPELKVIAAHWGGGLLFHELMPEVAETLRNVWYDTAATTLLYDPRVFQISLGIVGSRKILWGTDYPLLRQDRLLERVRGLGLPEGDLNAVLGGNAATLMSNGDT